MNILSVDASTKSSGIAVYEEKELKYYNCITSSSTDLFKRIHKMVDEINLLIKDGGIRGIVVKLNLNSFKIRKTSNC